MIQLYTYEDIAKLFEVRVSTVRKWKQAGEFKIVGYRRLGKWAKKAIVSEEQVKLLIKTKYAIKN